MSDTGVGGLALGSGSGWLERTYAFVPRIGLDELRAIVVDDRDGIAARLDAEMQRSIDDYVEPWQTEAAAPVTANQFAAPIAMSV